MGNYRTVCTAFWDDPKVDEDFTPEDKYFFLYLLTNSHTNICGCYECGIKQMARDTGYNEDTVTRLLNRLTNVHRVIDYDYSTREILIINWHKYNLSSSEKALIGASKVAEHIKSNNFKNYVYAVIESKGEDDTISIPYQYPIDTSVSVSVSNTVSNTVSNNFNNNISSKVKEEIEQAVLAWNALGISKVTKIPQNSDRYKQLKKRIEEYGIDEVLRAIQVVGRSDFLNGTNDKGWNATFDWLVKPNNFLKVIEGNYDRSSKASGGYMTKAEKAKMEMQAAYDVTEQWLRSHENDV